MASYKNSLDHHDLTNWGKNTLIFSTPAILAFLIALQAGASLEFAQGAAYSALLGSLIDLFKKFRTDNI